MTTEWIESLNNLQVKRTAMVYGGDIDLSLLFRYSFLPEAVQAKINLITAKLHGLFQDIRDGDEGYLMWKNTLNCLHRNPDFTSQLRTRKYHLWPINVMGDHWVSVFVRMEKSGKEADFFDLIAQVVVLDPMHHHKAAGWVARRVKKVFKTDNVELLEGADRQVWIPTQHDEFSCGIRCYTYLNEMMRRIKEVEITGNKDPESLFEPFSGYFDADEMRHEMIGLVAAMGLRDQKYVARVAVEVVEEIYRDPWKMEEFHPINAGELAPLQIRPKPQVLTDETLITHGGFF